MPCQVLKRHTGPDLAYDFYAGNPASPVVLYLSGYRGDRTGAKVLALAAHIPAYTSYGFLCFDYQGLGESDGAFDNARISDWLGDARDVLVALVPENRAVIVVGSSMGGWLGLRLLIDYPNRIAGFVGIAAAPDFTRAMMDGLTALQRDQLAKTGRVTIPSNTPGYDPYDLTQDFLDDGNRLCLLGQTYQTTAPIILLHGDLDGVVPHHAPDLITRAFPHARVQIERVPDGDHSLSRPQDLTRLYQALDQITAVISAGI